MSQVRILSSRPSTPCPAGLTSAFCCLDLASVQEAEGGLRRGAFALALLYPRLLLPISLTTSRSWSGEGRLRGHMELEKTWQDGARELRGRSCTCATLGPQDGFDPLHTFVTISLAFRLACSFVCRIGSSKPKNARIFTQGVSRGWHRGRTFRIFQYGNKNDQAFC